MSSSRLCLLGFVGLLGCLPRIASAQTKRCVEQSNDGAELRYAHQLIKAREAYRACISEPQCPAIVRSECDAALNDIKASIPTLLVAVVDGQGHDLTGAVLSVDGQQFPLDGSAHDVDPGAHHLVAEHAGLRAELDVIAIESDVNRRIEITLQAPKPAVEPSPAAPRPDERAVVPPPHSARSYTPAYVLAGVGVLGAASFGYFGLSGRSELNRLYDCEPYCAASDVNRVRSKFLVADLSLGVSVLAFAGAGIWLLTAPSENSERAALARPSPISFAINAAPGGAGLSVRWVE